MGIYTDAIQKLYVAYFSRPADAAGLAYWESVVAAAQGDTSAVSAAFAASTEYQDTYAKLSSYQVINTIYLNLFGRQAEPEALLFWGRALDNKDMTIAEAVKTIAQAAQGADADAYASKVEAATAFTNALATTQQILGYQGAKANAAAKQWLAGVTDAGSLASATDAAALATSVGTITETGLAAVGQQLELTNGIDTVKGGSANDTITAVWNGRGDKATTLTDLDVIDGGAGKDTLAINALDILDELPSVTLNNVEVVSIRAAAAVDVDISGWSSVQQLNLTEVRGNADLTASASADINATVSGAAVGEIQIGGGNNVTVKATERAGGYDTTVSGAKGVVNVDVVGAAAVDSSDLSLGDITVSGGTTVNVTQTTGDTSAYQSTTIRTHYLGEIDVNGDANTTTVNVKQTSSSAGQAYVAAVAGVKEVATVKFTALKAHESFTIDGLTFTAAKNLTAAEVAQAFANLAAGKLPVAGDTQGSGLAANGTYTGFIANYGSGAANGDTVVFTANTAGLKVSKLTVIGGNDGHVLTAPANIVPAIVDGVNQQKAKAAELAVVTGEVNVNDNFDTIKSISIDSFGAQSDIRRTSKLENLSLKNVTGDADLDIDTSAATLALQLENINSEGEFEALISFTNSPSTLNVTSIGDNVVDLVAAQTETLNVAGTGALIVDGCNANLSQVKAITVTESAGLDTGALVLGAKTINAAGTTGDVAVAFKASATTYTGGAGSDEVTLAAETGVTLDKSIALGAGNDTLDASALAASDLAGLTGTWNGGEGTDTLKLAAAAAETLSDSVAFEAKIAGFEKLGLGLVAADASVNLDNLDDINYVVVSGNAIGADGAILTLENALNDATVELEDDANVVVKLKDATGKADAVNVVVSGGSDSVVTADDVETINISATTSHMLTVNADAATTINLAGKAAAAKATSVGTQVIGLSSETKAVTLIDGSSATSNLVVDLSSAATTKAVTVQGGAGNDILFATLNNADVLIGGAGDDTLYAGKGMAKLTGGEGNDMFVISEASNNVNSYATIMDFTKGDLIRFAEPQLRLMAGPTALEFNPVKVELGDTAVFQDYANAAINALDLNQIGWFVFEGNTYLVADVGVDGKAGFTEGEDLIVKVIGVHDFDQASFNADFGTIGLV